MKFLKNGKEISFKEFMKGIKPQGIFAYVTEDKDGTITLHEEYPHKSDCGDFWESGYSEVEIPKVNLPKDVNPKWEDDEPIKVKLIIERA